MEQQLLTMLKNNPDLTKTLLESLKKASTPETSAGDSEQEHENITSQDRQEASSSAADRQQACTSGVEVVEDLTNQPDHANVAPASNEADEVNSYSCEELLSKRARNQRATDAQQTFRYSLRTAAIHHGIWDNPPFLRDIRPKTMEKIMNKVLKMLPQLQGREKDIKSKLAESLTNRRNHLKNTIYWKRALQKISETAAASENDIMQIEDEESTGFHFQPSENLLVMNGADKIARGTYLRHSKNNSDIVKLVLQTKYDKASGIALSKPNKSNSFDQLKPGSTFYWPENQLIKKAEKKKKVNAAANNNADAAADNDAEAAANNVPEAANNDAEATANNDAEATATNDDDHEATAINNAEAAANNVSEAANNDAEATANNDAEATAINDDDHGTTDNNHPVNMD
ncbi:hypothetical protein AC249_AIPGENE9417 [Exaiptasia diaphana]|nr:hypothetical protein AC249_AIPGENE9417 [Exaiptasia diaphana]